MGRSFLEAGLEKPLKPGRKESVLTVPACQKDWPGRGKTLLCQPKTLETAPNGGCIDFPPPGSRLRRKLLEGTGQIGEKHWGLGRVWGLLSPPGAFQKVKFQRRAPGQVEQTEGAGTPESVEKLVGPPPGPPPGSGSPSAGVALSQQPKAAPPQA